MVTNTGMHLNAVLARGKKSKTAPGNSKCLTEREWNSGAGSTLLRASRANLGKGPAGAKGRATLTASPLCSTTVTLFPIPSFTRQRAPKIRRLFKLTKVLRVF